MTKLNFNQNECEQIMLAMDLLGVFGDILSEYKLIPYKNTTYFENIEDQYETSQTTKANVIQLNNMFEKYGCSVKYHEEGLTKLFEIPEVISTAD